MNLSSLTNDSVRTDDGCSLKIRLIGHGPTKLLFIHGWMTSGATWAPLLDFLDWTRYTAVVPDLRGTGHSDKPDEGYSLVRFSKDIEVIIDRLGWTNIVLIGHSMGGAIGQLVAQRRPDALERLVLMAPVPLTGIGVPSEIRGLVSETHGTREGAQRMLEVSTTGNLPASITKRHVDAALTCSEAFWTQAFTAFDEGLPEEQLSKIRIETTIIVGSHDPIIEPGLINEDKHLFDNQIEKKINTSHYIFSENAKVTCEMAKL